MACRHSIRQLKPTRVDTVIQVKRIRHYGLLGAAHKAERLATARTALQAPTPDLRLIESVADFLRRVDTIGWRCCRACGAEAMQVTAVIPRPEWSQRPRPPP